jgi:hypothetical protein
MSSENENDENLLSSVAESVGSTLGTIAAKASAVSDALSPTSLSQTAEREGKKFVRKSKTLARRIQKTASKTFKRKKQTTATALRRTGPKGKRTRPTVSKKKGARRGAKKRNR